MGKKLIKNRKCKSIILLFLIFTTIVYLLHIYCINKNINGEWKQSGGGITGLPGFIYIDPNKENTGISSLNVFLYENGEKCAIVLLCTKNNILLLCLKKKKAFSTYHKMG